MDQTLISLVIVFLEIIEKPPSLTHEFQEATAGVVILRMDFEMLREVLNTVAEESNLYLWRAGICLMEPVLLNNTPLLLSRFHVFSVRLFSFLSCILVISIILDGPCKAGPYKNGIFYDGLFYVTIGIRP